MLRLINFSFKRGNIYIKNINSETNIKIRQKVSKEII